MRVSVLIPTLGRDQVLVDTVHALMKQTVLPDEIIIVDQNQPSLPLVDQALAAMSRVRHVRKDTPGYARNLNVCLHEAKSEIVLFLDDDVILDPRLIEMHLAHYQGNMARVDGVAGRVEQPSGDLPPEKIREVAQYHRWSGQVVAQFNARHASEAQIAPGGNMSFRRQVLVDAGGFDLGFDGNGYRCETDACLRVVAAGGRMVFEPRAELKHLMAPAGGLRMKDKARHTYWYVRNGLRLYRRHSPALGVPLFALQMAAYSIAKSLYNLQPRIGLLGLNGVWDGLTQSMRIEGEV